MDGRIASAQPKWQSSRRSSPPSSSRFAAFNCQLSSYHSRQHSHVRTNVRMFSSLGNAPGIQFRKMHFAPSRGQLHRSDIPEVAAALNENCPSAVAHPQYARLASKRAYWSHFGVVATTRASRSTYKNKQNCDMKKVYTWVPTRQPPSQTPMSKMRTASPRRIQNQNEQGYSAFTG